jgi:hypothetical protein
MNEVKEILADIRIGWYSELAIQILSVSYAIVMLGITSEKLPCSDSFCCESECIPFSVKCGSDRYTFDSNKLPFETRMIITKQLHIKKFTACKKHFIAKISIVISRMTFVMLMMLLRGNFISSLNLDSTNSTNYSLLTFKMIYSTALSFGLGNRKKVSLTSGVISNLIKESFSDQLKNLKKYIPFTPLLISPLLKMTVLSLFKNVGIQDNYNTANIDEQIKYSIDDLSMCNNLYSSDSEIICSNVSDHNNLNSILDNDIINDTQFMTLFQNSYDSIAFRVKKRHIDQKNKTDRLRPSTILQRKSYLKTNMQKKEDFKHLGSYLPTRRTKRKSSPKKSSSRTSSSKKSSNSKKSSPRTSSSKKSSPRTPSSKTRKSYCNRTGGCITRIRKQLFSFSAKDTSRLQLRSKRRKSIKKKSKQCKSKRRKSIKKNKSKRRR